MKIVFIDDNELNRMVMEDMLEIILVDAVVETYANAKDFLALEIDNYDIVLTDIDMPEMDGFSFYNTLRKSNFEKPIIAVTALAVNGDRERMLMHGFNDYISKPIDMKQLEVTLKKYI